jgi:hypothetical protein
MRDPANVTPLSRHRGLPAFNSTLGVGRWTFDVFFGLCGSAFILAIPESLASACVNRRTWRVTVLELASALVASQPLINRSYLARSSLFGEFTEDDRIVLRAVLAIAVVLAFLGLLAWVFIKVARRFQERRVQQIQAALSGLGFTLREDQDELLRLVGLFKIGQRGSWRQVANPFELALPANGSMLLMDYYFQVGGAKNKRGLRQTLALISDNRYELLPAFVLAPENFFSRFKENFGAQDIDFEAFPNFSQMFNLKGDDEAAVRALFTPAVIAELERHPDITLEGRAGNLLMFRARKWLKPQHFPRFHEEAQQLAQLFVP